MANNLHTTTPSVGMSLVGGGDVSISAPTPTLILRLVPTSGDLAISAPGPSLYLEEGGTGEFSIETPVPTILLVGRSSDKIEITAPAPEIHLQGTTDYFTVLDIKAPVPEIVLSGKTGTVGRFSIETPTPIILLSGFSDTSGDLVIDAPVPIVELGSAPIAGYNCLVVNLDNGAITEYKNFGFSGLFEMDGVLYGYNSNGIYKLGGANDAGAAIASALQTMIDDFGSSLLKSMPDGLIGVKSNGDLNINTVGDNSTSSAQTMSTSGNELKTKRVKFPKGLISRYWGVRIENVSGADFTIDSIELLARILTRRINE